MRIEMPDPTNVILGFDPGGKSSGGRFGWSICTEDDRGILQPPLKAKKGLAKNALDAKNKVIGALEAGGFPGKPTVLAAGIDAPLFWSKKGDREIDQAIRFALRATGFPRSQLGGTPMHINSLPGSVLAQGMLLAQYLHEEWKGLPVTESHPRVLQWLLPLLGQSDTARMVRCLIARLVEHELDATLCAVAAWAMVHQYSAWKDLRNHADQIAFIDAYTPRGNRNEARNAKRLKRDLEQEGCLVQPFSTPVSYWMPIPEDL